MSDHGFKELTENAFEFLRKALAELEADHKHSVINFWSAVELLLKARLLREHWTLVLAKETSRANFEAGDFQSVTFESACVRLDQVLGSPLPAQAKAAFDAVRRHRNRMVHFHHILSDAQAVQAIATEQLRAWHWLHELLTSQWAAEFSDFRSAIGDIGARLTAHRSYVQAAFENLKPKLDTLAAGGSGVVECELCRVKSAVEENHTPHLIHTECRICGHYWNELILDCENCGNDGRTSGGHFECPTCQHVMYFDDIFRDVANPGSHGSACLNCRQNDCVIQTGDWLVCMRCLEADHV